MQTITDATFSKEVLEASLPVILDIWAPWCGPCKRLAPVLEELSQALEGKVLVMSLDLDNNPEVPSRYGVLSVPTLLFFKDGKHCDTKVGFHTKEQLLAWCDPFATP
jgi:thioredoxin 1